MVNSVSDLDALREYAKTHTAVECAEYLGVEKSSVYTIMKREGISYKKNRAYRGKTKIAVNGEYVADLFGTMKANGTKSAWRILSIGVLAYAAMDGVKVFDNKELFEDYIKETNE